MTAGMPPASLAGLQRQYELLQKEYRYELENYRKQATQGGLYRNIRQGLAWYPVSAGRTYYNSLNQPVIEIERTEHQETEHSFEYGKPVCFFSSPDNGNIRYFSFSAAISYVQENKMVVVLPSPDVVPALQGCARLGIQLHFDETSYKTMFAALTEALQAKDNRTALLREVLSGSRLPSCRSLYPERFPWLNASQEEAVNKVLCAQDVAVVHGPPGTGKTTTLVEAVYETLHRENQVLVCAQSNTAVDWIAEKLTDRGIPVLRIGNPTRVNDKMLSFTYERRFESHPDYPELWSVRKAIRELYSRKRQGKQAGKESFGNRLFTLRNRETELEIKIDEALFADARVIASTLVGAANKVLNRKRFSTLFIDEAAQALEAACWIAITKSDRVILAGDPCQLPPTVKCPEAAREGLSITLIEKIAERIPQAVSLLRIQYRMHEAIMRFSSHWFYHDALEAAPEVKNRGILQFDTPVVWYNTAAAGYSEACSSGTQSRSNREEARFLLLQLQNYILKIGAERITDEHIDFGIISPYKAQVHCLRRLIKTTPFFRPFRKSVAIHTVDGFQGQERDVIFISLVRANENGRIGFLNDLRRMNVAMTRARMKLVIIGDAPTLTQHAFYKKLYEYIAAQGAVEDIPAGFEMPAAEQE